MIFTQENELSMALVPAADQYAADPATDVYNTKYYNHITFLLNEGAGGTGTVKIEVEECTSKAGAGNTAIPYKYRLKSSKDGAFGALTTVAATGYTTVAGANKQVAVEIDAAELSAGSPFVRLQLTEVADSPCVAGVTAILSKCSYPQAVLPISTS